MESVTAHSYRNYLLREGKLLCELSPRKSFDAGWDAALKYIVELASTDSQQPQVDVCDDITKEDVTLKAEEASLCSAQHMHAGSEALTLICPMIVDDLLSYLTRNAILTHSQCMSMREAFLYTVAGKLRRLG